MQSDISNLSNLIVAVLSGMVRVHHFAMLRVKRTFNTQSFCQVKFVS